MVAGLHAVARRLHVGAQVELLLPDGQVAGHGTGLRGANTPQCSRLEDVFRTVLLDSGSQTVFSLSCAPLTLSSERTGLLPLSDSI